MGKGLRILLIDDNPDDRALIVRRLLSEFPGVDVEQILDRRQLDRALDDADFDVVVTDYQIRWIDGLTVLHEVRAKLPDVPVIMFTGTGSEEVAVEALKAGLDDYVIKSPSHFVRLPVAVRSALERAYQRKALEISEKRFRTLFEGVPIGLYRVTPGGEILDANPATWEMLGYPDLETLRATPAEELCADPSERARFAELLERREVIRDQERKLRRRDGEVIWVRNSARVVRGEDGAVLYYEGSLQDVTERKGTEEQLRLAQRMEAVGRLAGGIAHDFNNLLTIIGGYGDLLRKAIGADGVLGSHVETMMAAADRAAALTRQLLAFSRRQVLEPRTVHLNAIVEEMEPLLRRLLGEDVEIVTEVAPTIGSVKVDPGQMEQVIMNLAVNSRDAMPNGGRLVLATGEETLEDDGGNGRFHVEPGRYVLLTVTDTGEGMDAQVVERIFEPFFTTKEQDKGTGLGLSTVYGIVKQSGGYIYVFSRPGHGATFRIYLPRVEEEAAIQEARGPEASPGGGSETILVVEDEDGIRNLVRSVLALGGYHVLAAASAQEALDRAAEHRGRIDLLLTDVVMPGMGGRELVESLRPLRPDTRILYMSGYTADGELRRHLVETQAAFLQKPFTPDGLLAKAREVLGLPGSAPEILQRQPSSDSR